MERRTCLKAVIAALPGAAITKAAAGARPGIQLHVDLTFDLSREKEMLKTFEQTFKPAAIKHPGYVDVELLKLRSTVMGKAPGDANYRFVLIYESEEMRQKWIASDVHKQVWPAMENFLKHKNYTVLLYDYPKSSRA